jgi:DNA repair protein RadC
MTYETEFFTSPADTKHYLRLKLGSNEREVFAVLYLNNRHQLISYEELFFGTIDGATVHVREIVKLRLKLNAAAIILAHNHPSGTCEPSRADEVITQRIKEACALMEIRVLDHLVVSAKDAVSMAERGLI